MLTDNGLPCFGRWNFGLGLAEKLLASLEDLSEEENARLWAEEAARRDAEWDRAAEPARSAEDVFLGTKARLK